MLHRLNYHHLRYFWAVAREGHLTRAAERLDVPRSSLYQKLKRYGIRPDDERAG